MEGLKQIGFIKKNNHLQRAGKKQESAAKAVKVSEEKGQRETVTNTDQDRSKN